MRKDLVVIDRRRKVGVDLYWAGTRILTLCLGVIVFVGTGFELGRYQALHGPSGETSFFARADSGDEVVARSFICYPAGGSTACTIAAWKSRRDCELAVSSAIDMAKSLIASHLLMEHVQGKCTNKKIEIDLKPEKEEGI